MFETRRDNAGTYFVVLVKLKPLLVFISFIYNKIRGNVVLHAHVDFTCYGLQWRLGHNCQEQL